MSEQPNEKSLPKTIEIDVDDDDDDDEDEDEDKDNAALDVTNAKFDPLRALYTENFQITKKQPKILYQNLAAFESALKRCGIWGLEKKQQQQRTNKQTNTSTSASASTSAAAAASAAVVTLSANQDELPTIRRFLPHQLPIQGTNKRLEKSKNVLLQMDKHLYGPLSLLKDWVTNKQRVHIKVRNEHGIRGYVEGQLICFDMHWNLLLSAVTEVWQRRKFKYSENNTYCGTPNPEKCKKVLKNLKLKLPESELIKSLSRKTVKIQRKLPQLFLRGEQVIFVRAINAINVQQKL